MDIQLTPEERMEYVRLLAKEAHESEKRVTVISTNRCVGYLNLSYPKFKQLCDQHLGGRTAVTMRDLETLVKFI